MRRGRRWRSRRRPTVEVVVELASGAVVVVVLAVERAVVLGAGHAGVAGGVGVAAAGRGLERHPAVLAEVHLGPGVGVAAEHLEGAGVGGVLVAPREADGHPGRDAEAPGHGGEGAGELLAVADPVVEEGRRWRSRPGRPGTSVL